MPSTTWRRARRVFEAALDRPTGQRSRFVAGACVDDPRVAEEVRRLLDAHRRAGSFLERPPIDVPAGDLTPLPPGRRVGAYRVIDELGRGGMGLVYLAERADEAFRKRVALKLVRPGTINPEMISRLREERQILARLEHPNIARLLDGGSTEEGLPYLVMESVEGEPIDRFCARAGCSVDERIALFRSVCAAVHFAHQSLIIHRDLKPSNILVTADGQVKLLDFGLARWTVEPDTASPQGRVQGLRAMTPEYASPEQIRGEALTTATDVYSLGVLLYELLTGCWPYRLEDGSEQVERAILEQTPPPPSARVLGSGRERQAQRLSRQLAGDLDRIILVAMAKRPSQRYGSVEQLSDDLGRYLERRPVAVRRATPAYLAGKLLRRHAAVAAVSAAAGVALLSAAATLTVQHHRLIRERDLAALERERSETVKTFTVELFEQFDPEGGSPEYTRFREQMLDAGVRRVESELGDQPEVRADLMTTIGIAYRRMARYDKASSMLRGALALRRSVLGEEHVKVAESLHELGLLWAERDRYMAAEPLLREALATRRRLLGGEHLDVAASLHALGRLLRANDDRGGAEPLLRQSLAMRRRLLGGHHPKVAESMRELAALSWDQGQIAEAERLWVEALSINRKALGQRHPAVADGLEALAVFETIRGDYPVAEAQYREALELYRRLLGEEHPAIARTLYGLAYLDELRGDYPVAEAQYRRVLAINRRTRGEEHLDVAGSLNAVARMRQAQGDYAGAESLFRQALAMNRRLVGAEHRHVAATLLFLAELLAERGDLTAAEPLFRRSVAMTRRALGAEHRNVARGSYGLAALLAATGRAGEGEPLAREALRVLEAVLPSDHWRVAEARSVLGGCLVQLGRLAEAEPLVVGSYPRIEAMTGPRSRASRDAAARIERLTPKEGV